MQEQRQERATVRVNGRNVGLEDWVSVAFHPRLVSPEGELIKKLNPVVVGLVGVITRIRRFDEQTGEPIRTRRDTGIWADDPELFIRDERSGDLVPMYRSAIVHLEEVDGPYLSVEEMRAMGVLG